MRSNDATTFGGILALAALVIVALCVMAADVTDVQFESSGGVYDGAVRIERSGTNMVLVDGSDGGTTITGLSTIGTGGGGVTDSVDDTDNDTTMTVAEVGGVDMARILVAGNELFRLTASTLQTTATLQANRATVLNNSQGDYDTTIYGDGGEAWIAGNLLQVDAGLERIIVHGTAPAFDVSTSGIGHAIRWQAEDGTFATSGLGHKETGAPIPYSFVDPGGNTFSIYDGTHSQSLLIHKAAENALGFLAPTTADGTGYASIYCQMNEPIAFFDGLRVNLEQGNAGDFRVDGTTTTYLLFTDAANEYVGLLTSAPASLLDINGARADTGGIRISDSVDTHEGRLAIYPDGSASTAVKILQSGGNVNFYDSSGGTDMQWSDSTGNLTITNDLVVNGGDINAAAETKFAGGFASSGVTISIAGTVSAAGSLGVGVVPTHKLDVMDTLTSNIAYFFNDGNSPLYGGIIIQCGADDQSGATVNTFVQINDGDGGDGGGLEVNSGTFQIRQGCDLRKKDPDSLTTSPLKAVAGVRQLRVANFGFKTDAGGVGAMQDGFVAQEVAAVFPEAAVVRFNPDTQRDEYSIYPLKLIPIMWRALQEQQAQIDAEKVRNDAQEARILRLEKLAGL